MDLILSGGHCPSAIRAQTVFPQLDRCLLQSSEAWSAQNNRSLDEDSTGLVEDSQWLQFTSIAWEHREVAVEHQVSRLSCYYQHFNTSQWKFA